MITLKTLPTASAQQVFDQVARHLLTQRQKSVNDNNVCVYRGVNNLSCAAGCLMADDEYSQDMEEIGWFNLIKYYKVPDVHEQLISDLQLTHDCREPEEWAEDLMDVASKHQLDTQCLTA